jgi:hypothetical protein
MAFDKGTFRATQTPSVQPSHVIGFPTCFQRIDSIPRPLHDAESFPDVSLSQGINAKTKSQTIQLK